MPFRDKKKAGEVRKIPKIFLIKYYRKFYKYAINNIRIVIRISSLLLNKLFKY